jgi:hypothetical protein
MLGILPGAPTWGIWEKKEKKERQDMPPNFRIQTTQNFDILSCFINRPQLAYSLLEPMVQNQIKSCYYYQCNSLNSHIFAW